MRPTIYIASAAALLSLAACGSSDNVSTLPGTSSSAEQANDLSAQLEAPFTLKPGQWASVAGTSLRLSFAGVTNDSRCPANVQCVWQGDAAVALRVSLGGQESQATVHSANTGTASKDAKVGAYTISLTDVQPQAVAGQTIAPSAYRVQLVVRTK